jgi:hypothetical protein
VDGTSADALGDLTELLALLRCADAVGTKGAAVIDAQVKFGVPVFEVLDVSFDGALLSPDPMGGNVAVTVCRGFEFCKADNGFEVQPL